MIHLARSQRETKPRLRSWARALARVTRLRVVDAVLPPGSGLRRQVRRRVIQPALDLLALLRIRRRMSEAGGLEPAGRPRILFVLHDAAGGIRETTADLLAALDRRFECHVLTADPGRLALMRYTRHGLVPVRSWWPSRDWSHRQPRDEERRRAYIAILEDVAPDLVHIRHLLGHTDDLVELCGERGLPVVLSFHDYYMACPGIHLLDDRGRFCGGHCTPSQGQCWIPMPWLADLPTLKAGYLESWRERVRRMLPHVRAFVTTSGATRDVLQDVYPELAGRDFRIIEHGRDFSEQLVLASAPAAEGPARVVLPGHLRFHKGSDFIRRLKEHDRAHEDLLELHFLGTIDDSLRGLGVDHGPYRRSELSSLLESIEPSFVGIFSVWPETYSHTLTEAWAMGVPVLASDLGAVGERVRRHGGGWALPVPDVEASYREILRIVRDPEEYRQQSALARLEPEKTVAWMSRAYKQLYEELLGDDSGESSRRPPPR